MERRKLVKNEPMDVLKDILDNLNDGIVIVDPSGQVVLFNNEALRIRKSISDQPLTVGRHITDFVPESRRVAVIDILKSIKRQKKSIRTSSEYRTCHGGSVFLETHFVPVLGSRRELKYVNIVSQDVTNRKLFEKKIRAASADFNNLLEQAHAIIFSVDSRGYVVDWNNHCVELTGFEKHEVLSQQVCETLASDASSFNALMEKMLANEPVGNWEFSMKTKSGGEVIAMFSATPRVNANGHVIGATLVGQDITELTAHRRLLEQQIRSQTAELQEVLQKEKEVVEMKSRFVSIASHEFRSPLSSIDYAASFIKQNVATINKKKLNEKVEVIEKHVNHMSHLLEDVLTFSRNEPGKIRLIPTRIQLDDFFANVVEEVTCLFKHSHHVCVSTNELGTLISDEKLLRNIVINLLSNAIKFSPGKEEVSLNVIDEGHFITVEVRDEGVGIPEDELNLIFEPFVRGKDVESIQGTGLGLSIVKKAVDLLQGTIRVKSKPGKGSVFKVIIPRKRGVV